MAVEYATDAARAETATLVGLARGGDTEAFAQLVARYEGMLWAQARRHHLDEHDAADVVQTTWLRLVEHVDSIRRPEHLGGWLKVVAGRESWRVTGQRLREVPRDTALLEDVEPDTAAPTPDAEILAEEEAAQVAAALDQLPERQSTLLRMLAENDAPQYEQISHATGIPVGSIGPTRGRALRRLRRLLDGDAAPEVPHGAGRSHGSRCTAPASAAPCPELALSVRLSS